MLNIFVSALSNFFLLSGSKFQTKTALLMDTRQIELATFVKILVATVFFLLAMATKMVAA